MKQDKDHAHVTTRIRKVRVIEKIHAKLLDHDVGTLTKMLQQLCLHKHILTPLEKHIADGSAVARCTECLAELGPWCPSSETKTCRYESSGKDAVCTYCNRTRI